MANDCNYEMKIRGSKKAINRVIACLKADYNYMEGKPSHKHFFRVFSVYDDDDLYDNGDGTFTKFVFGCCAWSVWTCMLEGNNTYYNDVKNNHPDTFMGTSLYEQSKDCEIEVFSEEFGMCFSEHYYFKNGIKVVDEDTEATCEFDEDTDEEKITNDFRLDEFEFNYQFIR